MATILPDDPDAELYAPAENVPRRDRLVLKGVRAASWVAYVVPWEVWVVLTYLLALGSMVWSRHRRDVAMANIRHVRRGEMPPAPVAWAIGAGQIATHFRTVIGSLRAGIRTPAESERLVTVNRERLEANLNQRGIVVVAPHAGPYPMLGLLAQTWLRETGFTGEFAIVARLFRPFRSGALMDWFIDTFDRAGVTIIPVHENPTLIANKLKTVLENKGIIALLVDEPTRTPSLTVPFFDSAINLPVGPVRLARATGSVIQPIVTTFAPGNRMQVAFAEPIEPARVAAESLHQIARTLETSISRHLEQWAMLTPIWVDAPSGAAAPVAADDEFSLADLHVHTPGSDGLCSIDEWLAAATRAGVQIIGVTDHDHVATVAAWLKSASAEDRARVLPGVELTARGRIVHLGVLFPDALPNRLPRPGTPLLDLVRWARSIPGSIVVLVHPLPFLWRGQLRRLAAAGLLPDAIESRYPLVGGQTAAIERAARRYGLAVFGGTDAHMTPGQLGTHVTRFRGDSAEDLVTAIRDRRAEAITRPRASTVPRRAYAWQTALAWLIPFSRVPLVPPLRAALFRRAQASARGGDPAPSPPKPTASTT